jgi:hypothetical protein
VSQRLVNLIDVALERFASRDLIASNELLDVLLDLRIAALDDAALEELLEQESPPTPTRVRVSPPVFPRFFFARSVTEP